MIYFHVWWQDGRVCLFSPAISLDIFWNNTDPFWVLSLQMHHLEEANEGLIHSRRRIKKLKNQRRQRKKRRRGNKNKRGGLAMQVARRVRGNQEKSSQQPNRGHLMYPARQLKEAHHSVGVSAWKLLHITSSYSSLDVRLQPVEGFYTASYQANFASHTRNHHVGFFSPQSGIGKHNKMSQNF